MALRVLTKQQSEARVKALRASGHKVERVRLGDGSVVVLRSKARVTKACHQCKPQKKRRKRRKPPKRIRYW